MPECHITITRYQALPQFSHRYGIAITRPGDEEEVKNVDTDNKLSKILQDVCGHTQEEITEILEELSRNPKYGPYSRCIDENTLNSQWIVKTIKPFCPVAIKVGSSICAPEHATWGTVTCEICKENFLIGPHRIYASRLTVEECTKRLETLLTEDHRRSSPHADSYEIPD